jgi:hypothetical protein
MFLFSFVFFFWPRQSFVVQHALIYINPKHKYIERKKENQNIRTQEKSRKKKNEMARA